jgi:hypothetical protein
VAVSDEFTVLQGARLWHSAPIGSNTLLHDRWCAKLDNVVIVWQRTADSLGPAIRGRFDVTIPIPAPSRVASRAISIHLNEPIPLDVTELTPAGRV